MGDRITALPDLAPKNSYTELDRDTGRRERLQTDLAHVEAKLVRGTAIIPAGRQLRIDYPANDEREVPLGNGKRHILKLRQATLRFLLR